MNHIRGTFVKTNTLVPMLTNFGDSFWHPLKATSDVVPPFANVVNKKKARLSFCVKDLHFTD